MNVTNYFINVKSDISRYGVEPGWGSILKTYLKSYGFRYTFWMRTAFFLKKKGCLCWPGYLLSRLILRHLEVRFGISIPYNTSIGPGLYMGHFGGIVVSSQAVLGRNCNINQGVTIGAAYGGKMPGVPVVKNNVYFGPGCKVIGGITVGDNVAIGANCVVTKSVQDNAVVAGVPGVVISEKGSFEYVKNTVT